MITLRPRPPLDFALTLERYRLWGVDPSSLWHQGALYRVLRVDGTLVPCRLAAGGTVDHPVVRAEFAGGDPVRARQAVGAAARQLLGLDADLEGFYARAATDPALAPLVRRSGGLRGLRPSIAPDPFEMLVGAISAQQVNLTFALTTRARLIRRFGTPVALDGLRIFAFPTPAILADVDPRVLRTMQFSARKAEYTVGIAQAVASGRLDLAALRALPDEEVVDRLTALRGLGRWTAEWFLARALGRPDVCPAGDLGVRRAVETLCRRGRPTPETTVRRRALAWRPYRSLAVHYLLAGARRAPVARPLLRSAAVGA